MKEGGESKDQQLTVALRIRPINDVELEEGAGIIAHRVDEQMVVLMDPMEDPDDILRANRSREKSFMFDAAFDYTATQEVVYRFTTKGLIEGVISGYNATVFAYGPTGCGKTYTMLGTDYEPGIYVRTLNDLFRAIEETSDDMEYEVSMSYLEIYNEMIRDLLNPSLGYLDLREDSKGVIQVAGITEVSTINAKEVMQLLMKGNKQRTQEPTAANKTSSRSHAVLQVTVRQKSRVKNILQEVRVGRLFMIDLAGSERASQTQNRGQRMKEGAHINRSLLALGNCINALTDKGGNKYINYRDSKLTRLLKDSLGGNSRTVMIAHISPASMAFEESRNTLTYADRAKNIKTRVKRNLMNVSYHIAQYTNIISDLRSEIKRLKRKIEEQGLKQPKANLPEVQLQRSPYDRQEMDQLREQLLGAFREQMGIRRHLMELENNHMEVQLDMSRHLLIVADWEQEKTGHARQEELRKETYGKDDSEKDSEPGDDQSDILEPQEVISARENITGLMGEQKKLRNQKLELEKRLKDIRYRARRLEELLPRRISSEEQREVLTLLCKVHELEIENTEMQSNALLKDNMIRQRNHMVQRYEQHRSLCAEIIQRQRQIINDHNLLVPHHLEELYEVYLRELEECSLDRITIVDKVAAKALKDSHSFLPKIPQLTAGETVLELDSDQESVRTCSSENQQNLCRDSHQNTLPPLISDTESDSHKVFKTSPRARQMKKSAVMTPPPIHLNGMATQKYPPRRSLVSLTRHLNSSPESSENLSEIPLTRKERKEILTSTKSIAVKAARRRSRVLETDRLHQLEPMKERSSLSLHSLSESEDPFFQEIPTCKQPPSPVLQHAASEDNLSSSTGEMATSEGANPHTKSPGLWLPTQKKGSKKLEKREESLEAKRKKRRSRSFEVTGQGLVRPKNNVVRLQLLESTSEHRMAGNGLTPLSTRPTGKVVLPLAKAKLPQNHPSGPTVVMLSDSSSITYPLSHLGNVKRGPQAGQRFSYITANGTNGYSKDGRVRRH
ncbi:kinesin-like protein KIF19 isoform X2 [Rhinatrema bivittatum]|uniref:kinesin-like protein KIF19 isoform X2 n=1 Tax=Rhinatrema bivittatum TaxID=194408 RepID=UPI00112C5015|nr:kinesin-like protein KIF19 isoform X2 [Rhinatrema bivittatum]